MTIPPYPEGHALLAGKSVVVTASAGAGIGQATARRCLEEGARVVISDTHERRLGEALETLKAEFPDSVAAVPCDVTDEASVARAVGEVVRTFGRLDGAFNNAGVGGTHRPLHQTGTAEFDRVLATNLRGPFLCMKYEIPAMLAAGGGSIVVTSSVGGLVGGAANTVYATSKHGLTGLVRCAALDYARAGIRVNAIAPGPTRSEMFDRWMPTDEARAAMAGHFPLNYIADPDDMARAALFLLSDESRWTTGTVFPCEGGITAR